MDIKITYTDNSTVYGHTKIVAYKNPNNVAARYGTGATPATNENVTATKAYQGQFAAGDITIDLAANNTTGQIRKPLIVVEGFDPTNEFDYRSGFLPNLNTDFNTGNSLPLNQGLDDINEYDLIFLNFSNGTDYIQRNAYLLERVIEIVNNRKTTWGGTRQDNVIIGMSMGGLVARYALRDMELNSQDHETRLFISHDTPHWGANIPVGLQAAVQQLGPWQIINPGGGFPFIRWRDMIPTVADALDMFNSPAAKQMLIQRYTLFGQSLTADNSVHNAFLNELNIMDWPQNSRNIALSNGSCNGSKQFADNSTIFTLGGDRPMQYLGSLWRSLLLTLAGGTGGTANAILTGTNPQFNQWAMLWEFPLSLFSTNSSIGLDFKVRAVPSSGAQEIYRGDIYSKKKILWAINVKNYFIKCHVSSNTGMLPLDNAPGGVYDVNEFDLDPDIIVSQLPDFFQGYITSSVLEPRFCFVPTVSSLAINNPTIYLTSDICSNINCLISNGVKDYYASLQNELHISYTGNSSNWILERQDAGFNCVRICSADISISGSSSFCTTSGTYTIPGLPVGATVTWSATPSGVVTIDSANAAQTTLTKNYDGVFTLKATIENTCASSPVVITKSNIVSGFPHYGGPNGADVAWPYGNYRYYVNLPIGFPPASSYYWQIPAGWTILSGQGTNELYLRTGATAGAVEVIVTACGISRPTYKWVEVGYGDIQPDFTGPGMYRLSPNPAVSSVTIAAVNASGASKETASFTAIAVRDVTGVARKQYRYTSGARKAQIDVSDLLPGVYYVEICSSTGVKRMPFIVVR